MRISISGLSVAMFLPLLVACSRHETAPEPIRSVKVITVGEQGVQNNVVYAGEVRARVESRLGFRVAGKLALRQVEVGQRVRAGQVLATLDPQDYELSAQAARAQLLAAQSQHDVALADYHRFESLHKQGFISTAELERREVALQAARAGLRQAQSQDKVQGHQVDYARLQATADGVVTSLEAEVGQVLTAGQPVLRLAHDGPRDAVFSVPEQAVQSFRLGQPLRVRWVADGSEWQGKVREIGASADPLTRTFTVKVALQASQALALGATLHVQGGNGGAPALQAIMLPTSALRQEGQGTAVWVLDESSMTVRSQAVTLGPVQAQHVTVLSGLQAGQKVVTAGVHVLSPGQKVGLYTPVAASQ